MFYVKNYEKTKLFQIVLSFISSHLYKEMLTLSLVFVIMSKFYYDYV